VNQFLVDSFILYKPRDIVAGDFYWLETIRNSKSETVLFAVADCTGHGVPGAMVSVVCSGALNRSVKEFHLTQPGEILDKVRELVLETFSKSEREVKDGMDISLCLLDLQKLELKWAGANNPLWIFRKSTTYIESFSTNPNEDPAKVNVENKALESHEIIELKPDKQPIGATEKPAPFTTQSVKLMKGDILYMSTDGYADQFGGHKGKKFKDSNMKKFLLEICTQPMEKQSKLLDDQIETWKGSLEQVDDICVAGVRI
jgi:serine phosphatase RsbU (regulator of sigma subunit)